MKRGHIYTYIYIWTSQLLDRIGPVGQFGEQFSLLNITFLAVQTRQLQENIPQKSFTKMFPGIQTLFVNLNRSFMSILFNL